MPERRTIRRLLMCVGPYRLRATIVLAALSGYSLLQAVPPYLSKVLIDDVLPQRDMTGLWTLALIYFLILIAIFGFELAHAYTAQVIGQRVMSDLRLQLFAHVQCLDLRHFDHTPVGNLMTRVTADVDGLGEVFTARSVSVLSDSITSIAIAAALLWMDWRLGLVTLAVLPLVGWSAKRFRSGARVANHAIRDSLAALSGFVHERIVGHATVQACQRESRDAVAFAELNGNQCVASMKAGSCYAAFYPLVEFASALAWSLILVVGGRWVAADTLTLGTLAAFLHYSQRFFRPITDLAERMGHLQSAMTSAERIFAMLDTRIHIDTAERLLLQRRPTFDACPALSPPAADGYCVQFDGVTFGYDEAVPILRGITFDVRVGGRLGIVGASGSGKTTIVNLLLRFYDVRSGAIRVDGLDIRSIDPRRLRQNIAFVQQHVHLFCGTVADNVRLGNRSITNDDVERALQAVGASRWLRTLRHGIHTAVAEAGRNFSTGQRQLLALARAFAFDRRILILDEATSVLSPDMTAKPREALDTLMQGRTVIAVAHRLASVRDMDQIIVLHRGELREMGTHEELLKRGGIYARMYQLQSQDAFAGR